MSREAPKKRARRPSRGALVRRWTVLVVLGGVAFSYYSPISHYLHTRAALTERRAEVQALRRQKTALERRLAVSTSDGALAREARRLGYVKPGEHLYIVKGIPAWLRAHGR